MKNLMMTFALALSLQAIEAQLPCNKSEYRQFDFWIGEWDVFGKNDQKAGESKISLVLDSCIILEEWTSATATGGFVYAGKSYNTYNASTSQWQQTWVDNIGGSTEFLRGVAENGKITFYADLLKDPKGNNYLRRLTFYKINDSKVRQHGEKSTDRGNTWITEYDLEYRRKK